MKESCYGDSGLHDIWRGMGGKMVVNEICSVANRKIK